MGLGGLGSPVGMGWGVVDDLGGDGVEMGGCEHLSSCTATRLDLYLSLFAKSQQLV